MMILLKLEDLLFADQVKILIYFSEERNKPFYIGKIVSIKDSSIFVNWFDQKPNKNHKYGMGRFAMEVDTKGNPISTDETSKESIVFVFDKLNASEMLPQRVIKEINDNSTVKWKIPKK